MTRQIDKRVSLPDGLHFSKKGKEMLAIGLSRIIYDDLRDDIIGYRHSIRRYNYPINLDRIYSRPTFITSGNKILFLFNFRFWPMNSFSLWFHTAEAVYQWVKAETQGYHRLAADFLTTQSGRETKNLADLNIPLEIKERFWNEITKSAIMTVIQIRRTRFDPDLMRLLKQNQHALIENTSNDFWARGRDYMGRNELGRILMKITANINDTESLKTIETNALRAFELEITRMNPQRPRFWEE